jgi:hypothetical protein
MEFILLVFWINFILFIWFETDAIVEYSKLFRLQKFFKVDKFENYKKEFNPSINYHSYIRQKHETFITKLITCVPCFNFWIVILICLVFNKFIFFPVLFLSSYLIHKILKKYIYG